MNGSPHTLKMPQFIKKIHKMNKQYLNLFSIYFFYIQQYLVTAFAVFQKYTTPRSSTPSGAGAGEPIRFIHHQHFGWWSNGSQNTYYR